MVLALVYWLAFSPVALQLFSNLFDCFRRSKFFRKRFIVLHLCMASLLTELGTVENLENLELLSAVPAWEYLNFARLFSESYNARRFLGIAVNGGSLSMYCCQRRLRDTWGYTHEHLWRALYVRRLPEMLRTDISCESNVVKLSHSFLSPSLSSFYFIQKMGSLGRELNLEVRQGWNVLPFCWQNI